MSKPADIGGSRWVGAEVQIVYPSSKESGKIVEYDRDNDIYKVHSNEKDEWVSEQSLRFNDEKLESEKETLIKIQQEDIAKIKQEILKNDVEQWLSNFIKKMYSFLSKDSAKVADFLDPSKKINRSESFEITTIPSDRLKEKLSLIKRVVNDTKIYDEIFKILFQDDNRYNYNSLSPSSELSSSQSYSLPSSSSASPLPTLSIEKVDDELKDNSLDTKMLNLANEDVEVLKLAEKLDPLLTRRPYERKNAASTKWAPTFLKEQERLIKQWEMKSKVRNLRRNAVKQEKPEKKDKKPIVKAVQAIPVKRGPGRPRKHPLPVIEESESSSSSSKSSSSDSDSSERSDFSHESWDDISDSDNSGEEDDDSEKDSEEESKNGKPRTSKAPFGYKKDGTPKKKRGRPKKGEQSRTRSTRERNKSGKRQSSKSSKHKQEDKNRRRIKIEKIPFTYRRKSQIHTEEEDSATLRRSIRIGTAPDPNTSKSKKRLHSDSWSASSESEIDNPTKKRNIENNSNVTVKSEEVNLNHIEEGAESLPQLNQDIQVEQKNEDFTLQFSQAPANGSFEARLSAAKTLLPARKFWLLHSYKSQNQSSVLTWDFYVTQGPRILNKKSVFLVTISQQPSCTCNDSHNGFCVHILFVLVCILSINEKDLEEGKTFLSEVQLTTIFSDTVVSTSLPRMASSQMIKIFSKWFPSDLQEKDRKEVWSTLCSEEDGNK